MSNPYQREGPRSQTAAITKLGNGDGQGVKRSGGSMRIFTPRMRGTVRSAIIAVLSIAAFIACWHYSVKYLFNPVLIPSPERTLSTMTTMIRSGELFVHIGTSLLRVLVGYVVGCALGIAVGALIGKSRLLREITDPLLEFIRPISPVAAIPLVILWFGIGELSKYVVIMYASLIIVLLNTAAGIRQTSITRLRAAMCLGASERQLFLRIMLPSAMPFILTGMRIALGFSFMGVVAAELIGAQRGIGFLIMSARDMLQTDRMFVGLISLGIVGAIVDRVARLVLRRAARRYMWSDRSLV